MTISPALSGLTAFPEPQTASDPVEWVPPAGSLLIVEDNPTTRTYLARWLHEQGYAVTVSADGNEALSLLAKAAGTFDLVLLDVGIPGTDGFEVLRTIRTAHTALALPVIMTTADGQSETIVRALDDGANDYVTKPYDLPVLSARVQTQLAAKRMAQQKARLERILAERNKELEQANRRLVDTNHRMKADLQAAARIQEALLPGEVATIPGVQLAWSFRPCEDLAGDTLNAFVLDHKHLGLYLLDVCGHGVSAALLSVHLSLILSPHRDASSLLLRSSGPAAGSPVPPAEVVAALNRRFANGATDRFFTLFYGILNHETGELRYACAGHPGPIHLSPRSAGKLAELRGSGPPVGIMETRYEEHVLQLAPGDRLYLYSDGVTEAASPEGRMFGKPRMELVLSEQRENALDESVNALIQNVEAWTVGRATDDISVLAVERTN